MAAIEVSAPSPAEVHWPGRLPEATQQPLLTRITPWLAAFLALTCYAVIYSQLKPALSGHSTRDFSCFYRAGKMLRVGEGSKVYNFAAEQQFDERWRADLVAPGQHFTSQYFVSGPFVLLVFAPLSYLSFPHAELAWFWMNVAMLLATPLLMIDVLGRGKLLALSFLAPLMFVPVVIALIEGQQSILLLLLFTSVFVALSRERDWVAGCLLAATTFKPQLAIPLLLVLLITRRWRAVAGFLSACCALFGICVALVGWQATLSFPRVLRAFNQVRGPAGIHPDIMTNFRGMLYLLLHTHVSEPLLQGLVAALSILSLIVLLFAFRNSTRSISAPQFAFVIALTLLASYHCYMHDLSLLVLSAILVATYLGGKQPTVERVALILIMIGFPFVLVASPSYQVIVLRVGSLLLAFCSFLFLELMSQQRKTVSRAQPANLSSRAVTA